MPWKRTTRVLEEARRRGWQTVVAVDTKSTDGTKGVVAPLVDILLDYDSITPTPAEAIDSTVHAATTKWVLLVSDDEEPSPDLWKLCERPWTEACYGVQMLTPLPGHRVYEVGTEYQIRLIRRDLWRWVGDFAGDDEVKDNKRIQTNFILWHFATYAPRSFREEKMRRYKTLPTVGDWDEYAKRHYWEENPTAARPMTPREISQFPE